MRKILRLVAPALVGAASFIGLAPTTSSYASTGTLLPISSYYQMVVDTTHGHIFISQGSSSQNGILVTDLTGQVVTTIPGQTGVTGIALSPDGSTLYAALRGGDAVTAISTTTLTQTASYPLPAGDLPQDVAVQSGKIWVSYNTGTLFAAGIGYFDPSMTLPTLQSPAAVQGWGVAPQLAVDPEDTGILLAMGAGTSWSVATYNTATNPVTTIAQGNPTGCASEADVAVAPGGAEFAIACHYPTQTHNVYSTASIQELRSLGSYVPGEFSQAIAYDTAGDVATGFTNVVPYPDAYVFSPRATAALAGYSLYTASPRGGILQPRGLALAPDGSELFGILSGFSPGSMYVLTAIPSPLAPVPDPTTTSVFCGFNSVAVGQAATCIASVVDNARDGYAPPTGTMTFTSDTSGGSFSSTSCTLFPNLEGQSECSVSYTPGEVGSGIQTVTVSYPGDVTHVGGNGQTTITVTPRMTFTQVSCQKVNPVFQQCTATVVDDDQGTFTTPTGTVSFTSSGRSYFSPTQCTLSGTGGNAATCTVGYATPPGVPFKGQTVTATYGGDSTHQGSSASTPVT